MSTRARPLVRWALFDAVVMTVRLWRGRRISSFLCGDGLEPHFVRWLSRYGSAAERGAAIIALDTLAELRTRNRRLDEDLVALAAATRVATSEADE